MSKLIQHFNVRVITIDMVENCLPSLICGRQRDGKPNIQNGFLIYENLDGGMDGVNLMNIAKFTIEPVFKE